MTFVANCRDIFVPVPFPPSPFGFRRVVTATPLKLNPPFSVILTQNKGTQRVQARYGAELPPFISIVRYPGRPVIFRGFAKFGGFQKGGFGGCSPGTKTGTRVRSPKPPFWKPPFYLPVTLFGGFQKGGFQKGGFGGCSPGTKTGTRVRSPKPPFYETALLSPSEYWAWTFAHGTTAIFVAFTGSEQQSPRRTQIRHFRRFRQNPSFGRGQRYGLPKAPCLLDRKTLSAQNSLINLVGAASLISESFGSLSNERGAFAGTCFISKRSTQI